ncbi:hypothetical protein CAPTEDRAFT_97207 [Capitella teleta]|uniref:Uncharacterized protein n=1 Tax=Capitella teleta TaxID=283909 RepID=R7UAC0_CAPTE|nr:hypothetical protein CAPTEDRAFT_97207 [Capitella teleta]|eukprot:ELU00086.1 hypothetical protein CAPTEDRAFT_97207 [Capitella teleta]
MSHIRCCASEFKLAIITPAYKGGDQSQFHYRPISVLPVFSKAFERTLFGRLYDFLQERDVLPEI